MWTPTLEAEEGSGAGGGFPLTWVRPAAPGASYLRPAGVEGVADPMASRTAEQREKVGAHPVHQLGDGDFGGKSPPHLQAEPFPCGGPGQIARWDPCEFDHLASIEGSKVVPDLTYVSAVIKRPHPGVVVVRAITFSPAAGDLPIPQSKGRLPQFSYLGDVVLPYHNYEGTAVSQGAGFPLEDVLA